MSEYKELKSILGDRIEDSVIRLLESRMNGELAYINHNNVKLYSDTVTMDGAYKEIIGVTKGEYDEELHKMQLTMKKLDKEHENYIPRMIKFYKNEGRKVLHEKYWDDWDIIEIRLRGLYKGMELGNCLSIIKTLNSGEGLAKAKEELSNQNHSGMSHSLVCAMVQRFSDRGNEFVEYVNK